MNNMAKRLGVDEVLRTEVVVVGTGVAGMSTALACGRDVMMLTKTTLQSGSSPLAQGGLAAAVGPGDGPGLHAADTVTAARGLGDPEVIRLLVEAAGRGVERLTALGTRFDRDAMGNLALGREGGHGRNRIVHARGDCTGAEIVRALAAAVSDMPRVLVRERFLVQGLLLADSEDRAVGVWGTSLDEPTRRVAIMAGAVVLASGGLGQAYARTTNPLESTGDGIAIAARAGARLSDMEFVQFHPTALAGNVRGAPAPLLTEALRGAGAHLVDQNGTRIMLGVHPLAELAPRDIVARTIWAHRQAGDEVFLDVRDIADRFAEEFPTVVATCADAGIDPTTTHIPVAPAAHYFMGGVDVDADGRSSLAGLWACGEVSCTGVHGANRLASNSLLEALVFGERVAAAIGREQVVELGPRPLTLAAPAEVFVGAWELRRDLADTMWRDVGLERDSAGLGLALEHIARIESAIPPHAWCSRDWTELRNLCLVGRLIARAALKRCESRGAHFRRDYPLTSDVWASRQSVREHVRGA